MDKLLLNIINTESSVTSILTPLEKSASASPKKDKGRSGAGLWNQALAQKKNQIEVSIKKKENQMLMQ